MTASLTRLLYMRLRPGVSCATTVMSSNTGSGSRPPARAFARCSISRPRASMLPMPSRPKAAVPGPPE